MAEDKFFLKWGNHEKNLAEAFKSLKSDGGFFESRESVKPKFTGQIHLINFNILNINKLIIKI